jgi:hypothetical protein
LDSPTDIRAATIIDDLLNMQDFVKPRSLHNTTGTAFEYLAAARRDHPGFSLSRVVRAEIERRGIVIP